MAWFRLYESVLDDPKVQRLPAEIFRAWINLLCLAKRHDGVLPSVADIGYALRKSPQKTRKIIESLVSAQLLTQFNGVLAPHNWAYRQYESDVSTQRVRRHRERLRNVSRNADETASETPPETEQSRAEQRSPNGDSSSPAGDAPPKPSDPDLPGNLLRQANGMQVKIAVDAYNAVAERIGLPIAQKLTEDRRRKLRARLHDVGEDGWQRALANLETSRHCRGENDRGWRADLDFLLQPKSLNRLIEGTYNHDPPNGGAKAIDWDYVHAKAEERNGTPN